VPMSRQSYKYILVIIDACSRYVRLFPLFDLTAESAARIVMEHMTQFGIPNEICTDNSTQFEMVFKEMLEMLSIKDYKIQPYSHQENSIVERANKEVLRHLRNFIFDRKVITDWPDFLPQVEQIMNSHASQATGVAPVDMVFAGQVNLNQGKLFPQPPYNNVEPMSEYMQRIIKRQESLLQIAARNQNETDMFHLAKNSGTSTTEFPINSFVTVAYENDEHKPPSKLHNRRRGPFRILSKTTREEGDVYNCLDLVTNKEYSFHVKLLHPFQYDVMRTNIEEVATTERQFFTVERVVSHRWKNPQLATTLKGQKADNLELEIKWVGYEVPEWNRYDEPSIKKVKEVITYLESNALRHLVPQNLRTVIGKRGRPSQQNRGRYKRRRSQSIS
ncbi:MAG: transposase, partial [Cyanobacteria bacterium WB6_1B_304]|nr:transposase [Cyanobacteria bacterium WB6_1B_304]